MEQKEIFKILIVDHDTEFTAKLKSLLNTHFPQAQITIVTDGFDAIEEYNTDQADIVIMEILLEGKNGWMVAHSIRDYEKIWDIPKDDKSLLISISSLDKNLSEITGAVYEINSCFEKPFKKQHQKKLIREIKEYLKNRDLL